MKDYSKILDSINESNLVEEHLHSRVLVIDSLNLFFRNFATMNLINADGAHIGGLAGFLRSLGALIKLVQPTGVYVIFDGIASSNNRKNMMPEYKSNRGIGRITNFDSFDSLEDENEAKVNQITRIIHYLQCLPIKVVTVDKAEADDVIAYLAINLPKKFNSHVTIVSSDKDYMQLVNKKVTLYRPVKREFYDAKRIIDEFGLIPENFIILKSLTGDGSDAIAGIKGLGLKTILKLFPELKTKKVTVQDLFKLSEERLGKAKGYAQILKDEYKIIKNFKVMDLETPLLDENQIQEIKEAIQASHNGFHEAAFLHMYELDGIGNFIRNIEKYLKDTYTSLDTHK